MFGTFPPKSVPVVLYTREQFRDVTRSPQWAAAAYDGIIRVPMRGAGEKGEDLDRVLAHEFSHALIRSLATRNLPTWLNEGLASVLESDDLGWANRTVAKVGKMPSLRRLAAPFAKLSGAEAQFAYAASAVAARRLLDEAGGAAIANLLRDLGEGIDFETAFLHRIQKSLADFEASLGSSSPKADVSVDQRDEVVRREEALAPDRVEVLGRRRGHHLLQRLAALLQLRDAIARR